jgi:predicted O-methyltransferase YrrM
LPGRAPATIPSDIQTACTRAELERLAALARNRTVLELGSYLGASTVTMASVARRVHAVDPHGPDIDGLGYQSTVGPLVENLDRYRVRERVLIHVGVSGDVVPLLPPGFFDLVFIDAMHQYDDVVDDLGLCLRVVRSGGTLAFHDYGLAGVQHGGRWHPFGVTEVVDELAAGDRAVALDVVDRLAVVRLA